jgi:polyphosphate kinase 2 (PPK2 family)
MLERTEHSAGPWHVVPGDDKRLARVTVVETVCAAVEDELRKRGYDVAPE